MDKDEIHEKLRASGVGLYNNRTKFISEFGEHYRDNPKWYLRRRSEKWRDYRDRLQQDIKGLGLAKSSFAIEMIYPNAAWISCIDVHMARFCGADPNKLYKKTYLAAEDNIIKLSKEKDILPTQFRWEYWDKNQGFKDCRYWSYCLEKETSI